MDVDGVLNAVTDHAPPGYLRASTHGLDITWRPAVVSALNDLHTSGRVELVWLTSWTSRADAHLAPLIGMPRGLRHLEVDPRRPDEHPLTHKLPALQRELAGSGTRFAWFEDEIDPGCAADRWVRSLPAGQALVPAVDAATGLGDDDLTALLTFVG